MNTTPNVIGLCGAKRSGKDEVYKALAAHIGGNLTARIAFADALKAEVAEACGVDVRYIERRKDNFRLLLQAWGSDFRRDLCGLNYWVEEAEHEFNLYTDLAGRPGAKKLIVFTDTRFLNEVALIKRLGGKIWRIQRTDGKGTEDPHVSERALDSHQADRILPSVIGNVKALHEAAVLAYTEDFANA